MSKTTCDVGRTVSDNKHVSCPARMSDGRLFTNYNSRCGIMAAVLPTSTTSTTTGYDTRQHMIHNADAIMQAQRASASCAARCLPCGKDTVLPEIEIDTCDASGCVRSGTGAPDGLGLGRNYGAHTASHGEVAGAFTVYSGGSALRPLDTGGGLDSSPWS